MKIIDKYKQTIQFYKKENEKLKELNELYKKIIEKTIKELDIWANDNLDKDLPIYDKLMFILNHYDDVEEGGIDNDTENK